MARTQTMVQLTDDLVSQLDDESTRLGLSRSALIRNILQQHLAVESERAKVERYVEGYRRMPQPTIDEWGNLEEQGFIEGRRNAQRMDAEEEAAGLSW
jgi:hypothetical protein